MTNRASPAGVNATEPTPCAWGVFRGQRFVETCRTLDGAEYSVAYWNRTSNTSEYTVAPLYAASVVSALTERVAALEKASARYEWLRHYYVAADFEYPQFEDNPCLIFALPTGAKVSANLASTIDDALDAASRPSSEPT